MLVRRWCWWTVLASGLPLLACQRSQPTTRAEPAGTTTNSSVPSASEHFASMLGPVDAATDSSAAQLGQAVPTFGSCAAFLSEARTELLARGFAPTQDTATWLQVSDSVTDGTSLSLVMRQSADGPSTWYRAAVSETTGRDHAWRRSDHRFCCDEHAAPEDHLNELEWTRRHARRLAQLSIVYFRDLKGTQPKEERALFESVTKSALDRCLDQIDTSAKTAVGAEKTSGRQ